MKKVKISILAGALTLFLSFSALGQQISPEDLRSHVSYLASDELKGRGPGNAEMSKVREYIEEQFKAAGLEPFRDQFRHVFSYKMASLNVEGVNIAGMIEGSDPEKKDEYVILGAHYDHLGWKMDDNDSIIIFNGADDNASGVATIIEIANYLNQTRTDLARSVVFVAFDAEEVGLIGSKKFMAQNLGDTSKIVAMFSLDMVGMYEANNGVELNGIKLIEGTKDFLPDLIKEYDIEISKQNADFAYRTDTKPFLDAGIPSVHVFTNTKSPYHKPEDDAHLLDYEGMAKIAEFMSGLTVKLANAGNLAPLKGKEAAALKRKIFEAGVMATIGSSYVDFTDDFFKAKPVFSGGAGLYTKINFTKSIALQPEIQYTTYGSQFAPDNIRFHAIHAPLNLKFKVGEDGNGVYAAIGGYYTYNFYGNIGNNDINFPDEYLDYDAGLTYGIGLEVMKFQLGFRSNIGLVDINDEGANKLQTRTSYLVIGYAF